MTRPGAAPSLGTRGRSGGPTAVQLSPGAHRQPAREVAGSRRSSFARTLRGHLPRGSTLPDEVWAQRHRWILALLWLHVPALFVFSLVRRQTLAHASIETSVLAIFAFAATTLRPRRRLSTVVTS